MAMQPMLALGHLPDGMNSALDPGLLPPTQAAKLINVQIDAQLASTRPGARYFPITGDLDWRTLNLQGARFYDPAKGQGTQVFADDSASIILASGGRKFRLFPDVASGVAQEITGEDEDTGEALEQLASQLLIWLEQAESYMIAGDDSTYTWIYDSADASFSPGYVGTGTEEERDASRIPHAIRCPIYAHGRLWVVRDARAILASDSIHGLNQTLPEDLLKFIEQVYWATGQYFVPPSSMGNIIAAAILPTRDTRTGQGEIMFHCVNGGIFSINGNIFPRDAWSETPMVNHFLLDTAASGPYALDLQEGDQLFRSRAGIQTLRSARAESRLVGRPLKPISEEVGVWLDQDHVPYLRYASLVNFPQQERLLCTTLPIVSGYHRYHKGLVVMNWDSMDSGQAKPAWEGMWTFPGSIRYISQMVRGMFADNERVFGIHFNGARYSLVEYDENLKEDVLEDGSSIPIQSRVVTRELQGDDPYRDVTVGDGRLFLRDICKDTTWTVYAKNDQDECWVKWRSGQVCFNDCDPADCQFMRRQTRNKAIELGALPESITNRPARRWQFLIEWSGWARIEALRVRLEQSDDGAEFRPEDLSTCEPDKFICCDLTDFDYTNEGPDDIDLTVGIADPGGDPNEPGEGWDYEPPPLPPPPPPTEDDEWTALPIGGAIFSDVCWGGGLFVAVASAASAPATQVITSPDGITWTWRTPANNNTWTSVCWGNGLFVAVSTNGIGNRVMTSPDGITWTARTNPVDNNWESVCYGNGLFVAVSNTGTQDRVMTSPDGITWTSRVSSLPDRSWNDIVYDPDAGQFAAVGDGTFSEDPYRTNDNCMVSSDGITWPVPLNERIRHGGGSQVWTGIAYGRGVHVVCGTYIAILVRTLASSEHLSDAGYSPYFIEATIQEALAQDFAAVCWGEYRFVAVSTNGTNRIVTRPG